MSFLKKSLLTIALATSLTAGFVGDVFAAGTMRVNALVMASNGAPDTMSRAVPIHRRVVDQLTDLLSQRGIQIYDADRLGAQYMTPGKTRYSDDELLSLARAVSTTTPLDVVVFFEVVADIQRDTFNPNILYPRVRMPGRIINIRSAQILGTFEVNAEHLPPLPTPCDETCVMSNEIGRAHV